MTLSEVVTTCINLNIPVTDKEHRKEVIRGVQQWCDSTTLFELEGVKGFTSDEMAEITEEFLDYPDLTTIFLDISADCDGDQISYNAKRFVNMVLWECVNAMPLKYLKEGETV